MRLIVSDIDGTVLPLGEREIDPKLFEIIEHLDDDTLFVVASGRNYKNIKKLFRPVAEKIAVLSENGTAVWKEDELIDTLPMERELVKSVVDRLLAIPGLEVYITTPTHGYIIPNKLDRAEVLAKNPMRDISFIEDIDEIDGDIVKVTAFCYPDSRAYFDRLRTLFKDDGVDVAIGGPNVVDITTGSKGQGLERLARDLGVSPDEIYAFGDNYNDRTMLEYAGNSYLVDTDDKELRKCAKFVTKDVIGEIGRLAEEFRKKD